MHGIDFNCIASTYAHVTHTCGSDLNILAQSITAWPAEPRISMYLLPSDLAFRTFKVGSRGLITHMADLYFLSPREAAATC
jgi:hypothetical protein